MADVPRTLFITGASSGIGAELTRFFAERGTHVWAAARRTERLEALSKSLEGRPGKVTPVTLDVVDTGALVERMNALDDEAGGFDCVIANAGVGEELSARKYDWTRVRRLLDVNVMGAAATLTALVPRMVERRRGHLVGVSSLGAWIIPPRSGVYCASKRFVTAFCDALRLDLAPAQIRVTAVHPGFVKSELTDKNRFKMPFLLETDDAARRMGEAIVRGAENFAFPWQTHSLVRVAGSLPDALVRLATRKFQDV